MADKQKEFLEQILRLLDSQDILALKTALNNKRSSDISEVVELVDNDKKRLIFNVMDEATSAEVLEKVDEATRSELFEILEDRELTKLVSELDAEDAADILSEMDEEDSEEVLQKIPPEESAQIKKLMNYSEDSAGGIMDPTIISVTEDSTVAQAVSRIRASEIYEDFFGVYVVDIIGKFLGDVRIRLLLTSKEDTLIKNLIDPDTIYISADADQEEVRNIFSKNDLIVAPVLDSSHRLIGRITADRIIEVAEEEAAEDLYKMAGTNPDELDDVSVFNAARIRMTWLMPCLIGTGITAIVMLFFKHRNPAVFAAVAAFVPMIAAISGNAGLQTSTIVISGLATGHLAALRIGQVFAREIRIAILVAVACGISGGLISALIMHFKTASAAIEPIKIASALGIGMFSAIIVATTLGLFLPFLFKRVGIDPAISSGPLVTTANDSISVVIYMTLTLLLST